MRKSIIFVVMLLSVFIGQSLMFDANTAEARSDYYIGYDAEEGCDAYIDVDSVKAYGYHGGGRNSEATVYWANGKSYRYMNARYIPSTGEYLYSGGAGGFHRATGINYNFSVVCDRIAYGG